MPLSPANGDVTVSGTAEGDVATFQCEEGLIPSEPSSTCTDTGQTGGQWTLNLASIQCREESGMTKNIVPSKYVQLQIFVCSYHYVDSYI